MSRASGRPRKTISYDDMEIEVAKDQFVNDKTTLEEFEQFVAMRLRNPLAPEREHGPDQPELTWHHDRRSGLLVIHFISRHGSVITISKDPRRRSLLPGAATTERQVLNWARQTQAPEPPPGRPRISTEEAERERRVQALLGGSRKATTSRRDPIRFPERVLSSFRFLSRLPVPLDIGLFVVVLLIALISPLLSPVLALPAVIVECILGALWVLWIT